MFFVFFPLGILTKLWLKSLPFHLLWKSWPCISQVKTGCTKACLLMSKIDIQWVWKVTETTISMIHTHIFFSSRTWWGIREWFSPCFTMFQEVTHHFVQVSGTRTASSRSGTEARTGQLGPNRLGPASNQCLRGVLKNHAYLLWWINV